MSDLHGEVNEPRRQSHTANVDPEDVATNENKPLPWHVGTRRLPLMWIGQLWNQRTEAVRRSSGGKKGK